MAEPTPAVELCGVHISYGARADIGPVSFRLLAGEVLGVIGGNGSGKTTVLKAICALQPVDHGQVRVYGRPVQAGVPVAEVGAVIEEPRFYPWLTGVENLRLAAGGRAERETTIMDRLCALGLERAGSVRVGEYSQGMRQRLGLARALLGDPRVLVLDEPTNGLDVTALKDVRRLVADQACRGVAIVIVSHLFAEVQAVADSVCLMNAGRVLAVQPVSHAVAKHGSVDALFRAALAGGS